MTTTLPGHMLCEGDFLQMHRTCVASKSRISLVISLNSMENNDSAVPGVVFVAFSLSHNRQLPRSWFFPPGPKFFVFVFENCHCGAVAR
jgi:hypothetical protein